MPAPRLTFWYEFASSYSYLSAMRIDAAAQAAGVEVVWQPFLLGPIFKAQGWTSSPFNLYPAKGRYMVRDIARIAASRGIAFRLPEPFPANTLRAARLALIGMNEGWGARFSKAVFEAEFAHGLDIASSDGTERDRGRAWPRRGIPDGARRRAGAQGPLARRDRRRPGPRHLRRPARL